MTLIERIMARLGWYRPRPTLSEIVVFRSQEASRHAGFSASGVLPGFEHVRAWWPGQGIRGLAMRPICRVTIPADMVNLQVEGEGALRALLKARQRVYGREAVWIEL